MASDMAALCDFSKPLKRLTVPSPSSRKHVPHAMNIFDSDTESVYSRSSRIGTSYVAEYVEREEKRLLESARLYDLSDSKRFEDISVGTVPTISDVNHEDSYKIYRTYDFAYRPKESLTINSMREDIIAMIETNSVVIIQGATGCGKTTQVPQFILDHSYRNMKHCNIIVTQPRRIAAISVAKRVSDERSWPVGTLVGYQVGMLANICQDTRLTFCTTGVLLRKLINTKNMLDYTHIILDEVHERDQNMDFLLLVVRQFLRTNSRSVKVILMSATFKVDKFAKYFSSPVGNQLEPAPIIDIAKITRYEINKYYLCQLELLKPIPEVSFDKPKISQGMMDICARLVNVFDDLDMRQQMNDSFETETYHRHVVLIFLPGIWEIEEMYVTLAKYENVKWDIIVLHSTITAEEQQKIFEKPPEEYRRIILSTNIAESSLTVPDVKYVIDFCLTKILVTDPITNFQCLELSWASKANCEQRAGRTGRVMEGRVYRLVPKYLYERYFNEEGQPEILRAPLEHLVLNTKLLDMGSPISILALSLDPPDLSNLENTILRLKEVGALLNKADDIEPFDGDLTDLGRVMAILPVNLNIGKLIALGYAFGVLRSTIIIAAGMSTKNMFSHPFKKELQAYSAKLYWSNGSCSDCITFLNVYQQWCAEKLNRNINSKQTEKKWAQTHFVQLKVLYEISALVHDLTIRLSHVGIIVPMGVNSNDDSRHPEYAFILKVVIAGAFYPNYFASCISNTENDDGAGVKLLSGLDPMKTVFLKGWPNKQVGLLYAKSFQNIFKECSGSELVSGIRVNFDGSSRVFITFGMNTAIAPKFKKLSHSTDTIDFTIPGRISTAVYKALFLRISREPIEIQLMDVAAAEARAKQLHLPDRTISAFDIPSLENHDVENVKKEKVDKTNYEETNIKKEEKNKQEMYEEVEKTENEALILRSVLPKLDESIIPLVIYEVRNPGHFWAIMKDEETYQKITLIQTMVNNNNLTVPIISKPKLGELVLAPYWMGKDCQYYRACVESFNLVSKEEKVFVYLVDFGHTNIVKIGDLKQFKEYNKIMDIQWQAFECVLANVRPSITRNIDNNWSQSAHDAFMKLISARDIRIYGKIYSVVNSVVSLTLICIKSENEQINVNEFLINERYAEHKEEDFLSQQNHEIRDSYFVLSEAQKKSFEKKQYDSQFLPINYVDEPPTSELKSVVRLRGPYSPLEIKLMHLINAGLSKKVHIDKLSVNAILLETNPADLKERLVVAGFVSQNSAGKDLTIRCTTLMPNITGLTTLLSLIFCPKMELRRDSLGNRYSGALCGLGSHPLTNAPLFMEHDMEINFDIELNNDDLLDINKLRHWISMALQTFENEETGRENVIICQKNVKSALWKIFEKKRKPKKTENIVTHGKWRAYDDSLLLHPGTITNIKNNIYPLHCALDLVDINPEFEKMTKHVRNLRELITSDSKELKKEITCDLCKKAVFGVWALCAHLYSEEHRKNEMDMGISSR